MDCFLCTVKTGNLILKEHEAARWLTAGTSNTVDWLPADLGLIPKVRAYLGRMKQSDISR